MSGPLYVPVLPTRSHAATAYRGLQRSDVQPHIAPLWTLPERSDHSHTELGAAVRADLDQVVSARVSARDASELPERPSAWVDAPFIDEAQLPTLATALEVFTIHGALRPVTGPERSDEQQRWARAMALRTGEGVGVRVQLHGEWSGLQGGLVCQLLERTELAIREGRMDLLLDLAGIHNDRPDAAHEALRALDDLVDLTPWRTIALLGGGVTPPEEDDFLDDLFLEPRRDWSAWRAIADSGRPYAASLTYGDYGVQPAAFVARPPARDRRPRPRWGVLRYTVEESYVAVKMVWRRGSGTTERNRRALGRLLELPGFRGALPDPPEKWVCDTARGDRPGKTGRFQDWLTVGNGQHMRYVARALLG